MLNPAPEFSLSSGTLKPAKSPINSMSNPVIRLPLTDIFPRPNKDDSTEFSRSNNVTSSNTVPLKARVSAVAITPS